MMSGNLANCGVAVYRVSYKIRREIYCIPCFITASGQLGAVSLTPMFFRTKIWIQRLRVIPRHRLQHDRTIFYTKLIPRTSCTMSCSEDTCCPLSLIFAVLLTGILQGVERPGSVYSNMPQR